MTDPKRAFYLCKNSTLRDIRAVARIRGADLIIATPTINMAKLREVNTTATVLAYYDMTTVPAYGSVDGWYGDFRIAMVHHTIDHGAVKNSYGNMELQLTFDAYNALARWINDNTVAEEFDGLYLDQCWAWPPKGWIKNTGRVAFETRKRWQYIRDYFILQLHQDAIVGNVGRIQLGDDPDRLEWLSGITVEDPHIDNPDVERETIRAFTRTHQPNLCVRWGGIGYAGLCMTGEIWA